MADTDQEDRTERASPKRLEEARRKGQVPRSRELSAAAVTLAGGAGLWLMGAGLAGQLHGLMGKALTLSREQALDTDYLPQALENLGLEALLATAPVLGVVVLAALLAPLLIGGWSFSSEALSPQLSRIDPLAGFKRMFSMNALIELAKALAKFTVVGLVVVLVLWKDSGRLLGLGSEPVRVAIGHAFTLSGQALVLMAASLILIAGVDVPYQLWNYARQLRMSKQELREEHKDAEGSPEMKGRMRQLQQQRARARMMHEVPTASVVITNPTHFAVALRYDDRQHRAPIVVAKGADLVAARIRELATEHNVPLFEAPPLARLLFRHVDLRGEIPHAAYAAVAQVLTYVYQLRDAKRRGMQAPPRPDIDAAIEGTH